MAALVLGSFPVWESETSFVCGCSAPAGLWGEVPSFAFGGARAVDVDVRGPRVPCVGPACGRSVVRCVWGTFWSRSLAGPFGVLFIEEMVEGLGCVVGLQGARSEWCPRDSRKRFLGFWKSQGSFSLCCLWTRRVRLENPYFLSKSLVRTL